jgi:hypothetical protein
MSSWATGPTAAGNSAKMPHKMGGTVLWETFDKIESEEFNVFLTDNWDLDGAIKIKVKATKVASSQEQTKGRGAFSVN